MRAKKKPRVPPIAAPKAANEGPQNGPKANPPAINNAIEEIKKKGRIMKELIYIVGPRIPRDTIN